MTCVQDVYDYFDALAPFSSAEAWDNAGLLLGDPAREVRRVLVCLDLTGEAADMAVREKADLVLTHHPVIFRPLRAVTPAEPWYPLLAAGTAVISMHTNLDVAPFGVNDALREALGLVPEEAGEGVSRFLLFGRCEAMRAEEFALASAERIRARGLRCEPRLTGRGDERVGRVAVCGGAGGEFWAEAKRAGAELLVTGEAKYHELVDAYNAGMPVMLLGHWLSEQFVLERMEEKVRALDGGFATTAYRGDISVLGNA